MEEIFETLPKWITFPALIASVVGLALLVLWVIKTQMRKKLEPVRASLGGEIISNWSGETYLRVPDYEAEARLKLAPGGENSPPSMSLMWMSPLGFDLHIREKSFLTKSIFFAGREVKLGDPIFDGKYVVRSRDQRQAIEFLQSPQRREAVDYFMGNGFKEIRSTKGSVFAKKMGYDKEDLQPGRVKADFEHLRMLVTGY